MSVIAAEAIPPKSTAPQAVTPMEMLQIAVAQGADLDRIQKLMDLQERWQAQQARKAFDAAISAAKAEIKPIVKNRTVDFTSSRGRTNYDYEDFAAIAEHVDPILAKHGLSYRHRPEQKGSMLTITCILSHRDGHSEESSLSAPNDESGNKNGIQGIGSTATYLQRYTLKLALGLAAAKDDDGLGAGAGQPPTQQQKSKPTTQAPQPKSAGAGEAPRTAGRCNDGQLKLLRTKLDQSGVPEKEFLKRFELNAIEELPFDSVNDALRWLSTVNAR